MFASGGFMMMLGWQSDTMDSNNLKSLFQMLKQGLGGL